MRWSNRLNRVWSTLADGCNLNWGPVRLLQEAVEVRKPRHERPYLLTCAIAAGSIKGDLEEFHEEGEKADRLMGYTQVASCGGFRSQDLADGQRA